jgi:monofunctional glycosyltransferase
MRAARQKHGGDLPAFMPECRPKVILRPERRPGRRPEHPYEPTRMSLVSPDPGMHPPARRRGGGSARSRLRKRFGWRGIGAGLAFLLGALLLAVLVTQAWYFHQVRQLATHNPETTAFMDLRRGAGEDESTVDIDYRWVDYADIAPALRRAVVAAEDGRFMAHNGFEWAAMHQAWRDWREADRPLRGASTISQQLAKNLFLSEDRRLRRKLQEAAITWMLESQLDKRRILELYLNVIEWGDGVFGAEAAAQRFHGVPAADLDSWQAAVLAARIPRPRFYHRNGETTFLIRRAARIQQWSRDARIP